MAKKLISLKPRNVGKCSKIVILKEYAVGLTFYLYSDVLFAA